MTKTILIDAAHKEETRVAVLENGVLQDFDREALTVKQIKGNIYLAKITRVEPSLQAAFVNYGSDRHGFLPFSDIHPDYYQLPESEKQKIKEATSGTARGDKSEDEEAESINGESQNNCSSRDDSSDEDAISTGGYSVEDETGESNRNINYLINR